MSVITRLHPFCSNASHRGQEGKTFMTHIFPMFIGFQDILGHMSLRYLGAVGMMLILLHCVALLKPSSERPSSLSKHPLLLRYMQNSHGH